MPSERKRRILAAIVELYNETGEPVGSKRLMEVLPDSVSSATIRNEMAELAELGFLEQPHTSAGRVPSLQGYRYYIDHLLPQLEMPPEQKKALEEQLRARAREPERLLENAGKLLAELTACTALCVPCAGVELRVKRVEIAPLGRSMAMLALLTTNGAVKSKVIRTESALSPQALEVFGALSREHLVGAPLELFTQPFLQSLAAKAGTEFLAVAPLLIGVAELAREAAGQEVLVGESHLFQNPQLEPQAKTLLDFLQSAGLARLLQDGPPAHVSVLLGNESFPLPDLRDVTMVLAPYAIGAAQGGTLGIVGPLRMDFAKVIPALKFIAALLGRMLTQGLEE
ncbi:MAG: heat-inducible transcriptional repressor HrcA [Oscillospiraceae bacterium]|jgi:heat-inducible transcriptional repressor|nr:heat-inducible transcriptional repressor HrcA [Oscillospiraceae bacterium]